MISVRETETLCAMETVFDSLVPFFPTQATESISSEPITRNTGPGTSTQELTTGLINLLNGIEEALLAICEDVETMVKDQNKSKSTISVISS
jgi:hypothetical protein